MDVRLAPLVIFVKHWAKVQNINDAKEGTISSFSLVLMVIHFMQCLYTSSNTGTTTTISTTTSSSSSSSSIPPLAPPPLPPLVVVVPPHVYLPSSQSARYIDICNRYMSFSHSPPFRNGAIHIYC